ncbi:phospholipase D-like domain-containing protein [Helicobacter sp. 23-1046]
MAKKKVKPATQQREFTAKMELLTHKYSDYYANTPTSEIITNDNEEIDEQSGFVWYDTKEVFCPVYKARVKYQITKIQPIHPIIISILNIVKELEKLKGINVASKIKEITQLDDEIYGSIIAELIQKGLLTDGNNVLKLTNIGKDTLKQEKEKIIRDKVAFVAFDGIFNEVLEVAERAGDINFAYKPNEYSIELKPLFSARPRTQNLYDEFSENKTLYQILTENLQKFDSASDDENEVGTEINNILEVEDTRKFFKRYLCLFYKNADENEKILVLDERDEIDAIATKLFDKLIATQNFTPTNPKSVACEDNENKFRQLTSEQIQEKIESAPDLSDGKTIEVSEHKRYFIYVLENAKKHIYIQSPWVRDNILKIYKTHIESALKRSVKVCIKYGMKPRNRFDKVGIDDKAKEFFNELQAKFPQLFKLKTDNNHSKILICDDEFMLIGSFNWLSFGGENKDDKENRGETSTVNKNQQSIKKEIAKFN